MIQELGERGCRRVGNIPHRRRAQYLGRRLVEPELSFLDELQNRYRHKRLGDTSDSVKGGRRDPSAAYQSGVSRGSRPDDAAGRGQSQ